MADTEPDINYNISFKIEPILSCPGCVPGGHGYRLAGGMCILGGPAHHPGSEYFTSIWFIVKDTFADRFCFGGHFLPAFSASSCGS